jgi:hypothetical protein
MTIPFFIVWILIPIPTFICTITEWHFRIKWDHDSISAFLCLSIEVASSFKLSLYLRSLGGKLEFGKFRNPKTLEIQVLEDADNPLLMRISEFLAFAYNTKMVLNQE